MTLELNQIALQIKEMGPALSQYKAVYGQSVIEAQMILQQFSTDYTGLLDRIERTKTIEQQQQHFNWTGAVPTTEAIDKSFPLPACPERITVIASDGSQILPDRHTITLYYLINIGSIVYRHGSNRKPETYRPMPMIYYDPDDILDEQGYLITANEIAVQRDLAELKVLSDLAPAYTRSGDEPVVTLMDGQLTLRVVDLPFHQQRRRKFEYITMLDNLRDTGTVLAGYIDRPRSAFVLSLMRLASLELDDITEETVRHNRFRGLTDLDIFDFLAPGERSAIFSVNSKGLEEYKRSGHAIHFFYLNVSKHKTKPNLARVELPAWVVADPQAVDTAHAAIVRQSRITGGFPYVLARADELAVISSEERKAVETMLAIAMRRQGLIPTVSLKQQNKNVFRFGREKFII